MDTNINLPSNASSSMGLEVNLPLTEQQEKALRLIVNWVKSFISNDSSEKHFFRLCGFAGTGKTFLSKRIIYEVSQFLSKRVAVVVYTHQARMVLASKGVTEAQTVHSFLYNTSITKSGEIHFTKKSYFDITEEYSMICVDEASMVNKTQREELESFGLPVLYIGDSFQLPPISQFPEDLTFLSEPEYQLTEVKRNTGPIIDLSMKIRNFERLQFGKFGEGVFIIDESKLTERMLLSSDQILVGKNISRRMYNNEIRTLKGYDINNMPAIGEPLLVLNNNPSVGLFNGTRIYSVDDNNDKRINLNGFQFNYLSNEIGSGNRFNNIHIMEGILGVPRASIDTLHDMYPNEEFTRLDRIKVYLEGSINFQSQKEEAAHLKINKCIKADFDYAKTVHKSQGSAYDKPIIIEEVITRDKTMHARWLYTAVTRAVRKLVLVKA